MMQRNDKKLSKLSDQTYKEKHCLLPVNSKWRKDTQRHIAQRKLN